MRFLRLVPGLLALFLAAPAPAGEPVVVVEQVVPGRAAHAAGLAPGDRLLGWTRESGETPAAERHELRSPFDLEVVEIREAPLGPIMLHGRRPSSSFSVTLPAGAWGLTTRPGLDADELDAYRVAEKLAAESPGEVEARMRTLLTGERSNAGRDAWLLSRVAAWYADGDNPDAAASLFDEASRLLQSSGRNEAAACLRLSQGGQLLGRNRFDDAARAFEQALAAWEAASPDGLGVATARFELGQVARDRADLPAAEEHYRESLRLRRQLAPDSLETAASLNYLGITMRRRAGPGDFETAEAYHREALAIQEKFAPHSLDVATTSNSLGNIDLLRGDLAAAQAHYRNALEIREELAPGSLRHVATLDNLAMIAQLQGDKAGAEDLFKKVLAVRDAQAPKSLAVAMSLNKIGTVGIERGDFASADFYLLQALEIRRRLAPGSDEVAVTLTNLGESALFRGELEVARKFYQEARQIREASNPGSLHHGWSLRTMGRLYILEGDLQAARRAFERAREIFEPMAPDSLDIAFLNRDLGEAWQQEGDLDRAESLYRKALEIYRRQAPGSSYMAAILKRLGSVAEARGRLDDARRMYEQALELLVRVVPGSWFEAESAAALAAIHRRQGEPQAALAYLQQAVDALEIQQSLLGGIDEVRTAYRSRNVQIYRDLIDLLVELGRPETAYEVLELSRGRGILALLAERELVFRSDIPGDLDQERRMAAVEYDRTQAELAKLSAGKDDARIDELRDQLQEIHRRRESVRERILQDSPRLAALQYPTPLDYSRSRQALDAGTALLSYSVGHDRTHVFCIAPSGELHVRTLHVAEQSLRDRVSDFRLVIDGTRTGDRLDEVHAAGQRLYDELIAPVAALLESAERLLIIPDGPLHLLPFGALTIPAGESGTSRYLIEWKPVHVAASATVWEELKKDRPTGTRSASTTLLAFGDPRYAGGPATPEPSADVQTASLNGRLRPLPATREEVQAIAELFGDAATAWLGPEATEERAKGAGVGPSLIHFAAHGLLNEQVPLDSAIALSIPGELEAGRDNGLLQAWEIFEDVRIRADLVSLSGCQTALGRELAGEGILGLTRAFQYAGARSVLASLWSVTDRSTSRLMRRFYGYMRQGQSKDQALRSAQLDMIRGDEVGPDDDPRTRGVKVLAKGAGEAHHASPFYWAAFQLYGDWR